MKTSYLKIILSVALFALFFCANGNTASPALSSGTSSGTVLKTCRTADRVLYGERSGFTAEAIASCKQFFLQAGSHVPASHVPSRKNAPCSYSPRSTGGQTLYAFHPSTEDKSGICPFEARYAGCSPTRYYVYFLRRIII